jgi:uncharacterized protein (DUF427 family)
MTGYSSEVTESVWDYPRPPAVVPSRRTVRIELGGVALARSQHALRVLETSHPPTIYIPCADVRMDLLLPSESRPTFCEWKGAARYLDAEVAGHRFPAVAWTYPEPAHGYESLAGHVAFYPGRVDAAWLDEERVAAQPGDFYGGWISSEIRGPFKGGPGTWGW